MVEEVEGLKGERVGELEVIVIAWLTDLCVFIHNSFQILVPPAFAIICKRNLKAASASFLA
jgi:hypothetical protein